MKNVFLVNTPLQLLNAIEAKYHFKLDAEDCLLIVMGDRKSQPQLLSLAGSVDKEFGCVTVLNNVSLFPGDPFTVSESLLRRMTNDTKILKKSIFNIRRLNKIAKYLGEVDYIFIGYVRLIYTRHFVNTMIHKKVFLLDDGTATLALAKERKQGFFIGPEKNLKSKLKFYGKRLISRVKDEYQESYSFFTMYDIDPGDKDQVIKNEFTHMRANIDLLPDSDDVYFLGSPLSEAGFISQDEYLAYIKRVKAYFENRRILYVAHRRESKNKLDKLSKVHGLKVIMFEYPIEYQLAHIGSRPEILASFISSALDSCKTIFGDKLKIISFKLDLNEDHKQLLQVYDNYATYIDDNFIVESNY